jgi:type I restriction enzyme, S subunit
MTLPQSWATAPLGKLCEKLSDGSHNPPKAQETGLPMLSARNIDDRKITFDEFRLISPAEFAEEDRRTRVTSGDVLLTIVGAIGRTAVVPEGSPQFTLQRSVAVLKPIKSDSRYISYALEAPALQKYLQDNAKGTAQKGIYLKALAGVEIPVAPELEQKRIADKLDTVLTRVDAVNTRLARVAPLLKRFRQSVLAAATSGRLTEDWRTQNPGGNATAEIAAQVANRSKQEKKEIAIPNLEHWTLQIPNEWTVASVHQFAECLDRLRVPIKKDQRDAAKGLYPYYGANGEVGRIDQFIFDDELVLVTEDETFYGREKPIAYRSSGKCWVNNHAHVLRCKSVPANDYLCFALMYYDVIPWLSGTTGRAKLTQQALLSLPIGAPPEAEQTEIVRRVETLFAFADRLEARLAQAQTAATRLTPALLAKAFRGELVPQDPNDEPAADLLRRLQQHAPSTSAKRGPKTTK